MQHYQYTKTDFLSSSCCFQGLRRSFLRTVVITPPPRSCFTFYMWRQYCHFPTCIISCSIYLCWITSAISLLSQSQSISEICPSLCHFSCNTFIQHIILNTVIQAWNLKDRVYLGWLSIFLERFYNELFQRENTLLQEGIQFHLLLEKYITIQMSKSSLRFIALFQKQVSCNSPSHWAHTAFFL